MALVENQGQLIEHRQSPYVRLNGRALEGVAVLYGDRANLGWTTEQIQPGAFAPLPQDVMLRMQHDRGRPIARTGGSGLVLADSPTALEYRAELPNTRDADDVIEMVKTGILRGNSVELHVIADRMEGDTRIVERAALLGLSVVDDPAYKGSKLEARWNDVLTVSFPGAPTRKRRRIWQLL